MLDMNIYIEEFWYRKEYREGLKIEIHIQKVVIYFCSLSSFPSFH